MPSGSILGETALGDQDVQVAIEMGVALLEPRESPIFSVI